MPRLSGNLGRLRHSPMRHHRSVTAFVLTPLGQQKADQWDSPGIKGQLISVLADSGPCTFSELIDELRARGIGTDSTQLRALLRWMIRVGYVRPVGADGVTNIGGTLS